MEKTNQSRELARFTIMLRDAEIREIRHLAVDQRTSASEILRTAVSQFLARNSAAVMAHLERDQEAK
jgi:hypothetical protein